MITFRDNKQIRYRYRDLFNRVPIGLYRTTSNGRILDANPALVKMLRFPNTRTLLNANVKDLFVDPNIRQKELDKLSKETPHEGSVFELRCFEGSVIKVKDICQVVRNYQGTVEYYEGSLEDITNQLKAQEVLQKSLEERNILLREIHHRVKNNLTLITSLISLQSSQINEPTTRQMCSQLHDKVFAISLVHEKLYRSMDFKNISSTDYIEDLLHYVSMSIEIGTYIKVKRNIVEASFDIDLTIPLGLIITELATNAMKHAFLDQSNGIITITLELRGDNFVLIFADNGRGLPEGFNPAKTESFGFQLVSTLVQQIGGTFNIPKTDKGTAIHITFPNQSLS